MGHEIYIPYNGYRPQSCMNQYQKLFYVTSGTFWFAWSELLVPSCFCVLTFWSDSHYFFVCLSLLRWDILFSLVCSCFQHVNGYMNMSDLVYSLSLISTHSYHYFFLILVCSAYHCSQAYHIQRSKLKLWTWCKLMMLLNKIFVGCNQ